MAQDRISIRLSVEGDAAEQAFRDFAKTGESSVERIRLALGTLDASGARARVSIERIDPSVQKLDRSLTSLRMRYDEAFRSQTQFAKAQETVNAAVAAQLIPVADAEKLLSVIKTRTDANTRAFQLNRMGMVELQAAGINTFQALASGMNPLHVATMESAQAFGAFAQGGYGAVGVLKALVSPIGLATIGVVGLVTAGALLVARNLEIQAGVRATGVMLKGLGADTLASAESLELAARRMREFGLSAAEARAEFAAIARAGLNPAAAPRIAATGQNLTPVLGDNGPQALMQALSGGLEQTIQFGLQLHALTAEEIGTWREMARIGQTAEALDQAFRKIEKTVEGLNRKALSESGQAFRDLRVSAAELFDTLAKSAAIEGLTKKTTELVKALTDLANLKPPPWLAAFIGSVIPGVGALGGLGLSQLAGGNQSPALPSGSGLPGATNALDLRGLSVNTEALERLSAVLDAAVKHLPEGYALLATSTIGDRPGTPGSYHPGGGAIDVQLVGPNGPVPNRGADASGLYSQLAGFAYLENQRLFPGTPIAWGGRFGVTPGSSVADLMHFDVGPDRGSLAPPLPALAARVAPAAAAAAPPVAGNASVTRPDDIVNSTVAIDEQVKARQRLIDAERLQGLQADVLRAKQEAEQFNAQHHIQGLEATRNIEQAEAAAKFRLTAEIDRMADATAKEIEGQQTLAGALSRGSQAGLVAELKVRAITEAYQKFGEVSSEASTQFAQSRFNEISTLETLNERIRNNRDLLAGRDTQDQLRAQIGLVGQLPEIAQRELTQLQAKQQIERDFPFLTDKEKADRLAMVSATADLNVKLAETQRAQQRIDDVFRSIGDTIANTIGSAIEGIFDKKKVIDWGQALKSALSSIVGQIAQSLLIRPLVGDLLGAFGASANVVGGFGSLLGGAGQTLTGTVGGQPATFNLSTGLQGAGLLKDLFGFSGSSSSGGLFGGVSNFLNNTIGTSLGFAPSGLAAGTGAGAGIFTDLGTGITSDIAGGGVASGLFGGTTFGGFLGGAGLGFGAGSLLNSLLGGNKTFGTIGSGLGSLAGAAIGSIIPGIGTLIGGLLGGAGGGLLGGLFGNNKPRNASAGASFDLSNFSLGAAFGGGNQQIDQATAQAAQQLQQFMALLKTSGGSLGSGQILLQNGVNTGFTVDSDLVGYSGRFNLGKDPTAAVQTVELALTRSLTNISATMRTVLDQTGDPARLQANIAFANTYDALDKAAADAFKTVEQGKNELGPFATAMDQIKTVFQGLTDQATQFGLSLDPINASLAEATKRLQGDFGTALDTALNEATGQGFVNQLQGVYDATLKTIQESQAIGLGDDPTTQQKIDQLYQAQLNQILTGLSTAQLGVAIEHFTGLNDAIVLLAGNAKTAAEQLAEAASALKEQFQPLVEFKASLTGGDLSGLNSLGQLRAANDNFNSVAALVTAGDVSQIGALIASGQSALQLSQTVYGNDPHTSDLRSQILAAVSSILSAHSFAGGGVAGAGWNLVGERGPEWMYMPSPSAVYPSGSLPTVSFGGGNTKTLEQKLDQMIALLTGNNQISRVGLNEVIDRLRQLLDAAEREPITEPARTKVA